MPTHRLLRWDHDEHEKRRFWLTQRICYGYHIRFHEFPSYVWLSNFTCQNYTITKNNCDWSIFHFTFFFLNFWSLFHSIFILFSGLTKYKNNTLKSKPELYWLQLIFGNVIKLELNMTKHELSLRGYQRENMPVLYQIRFAIAKIHKIALLPLAFDRNRCIWNIKVMFVFSSSWSI